MTMRADEGRLAELEEDNRRLRRLLDQRDVPRELRHRLRSTLALLRAIVRSSAHTGRDLAGYVDQLEDRLDAIIRAQALADQHGEVDLRTLVAEELFHYGASENERLKLSGPTVSCRPRAGQLLSLAIHELAVNAVEHGALGTDHGHVDVSWIVASDEPNAPLLLSWTEFDPAPKPGPQRHGFGTEVLTRMLRYELKCDAELTFRPRGLQCTISLPLGEAVGCVVTG